MRGLEMENSNKKNRIIRRIITVVVVILSFVVITAAILAGTLYFSIKSICSDRSPAARQMFVTTLLETGQLKFLVSWFLFISYHSVKASILLLLLILGDLCVFKHCSKSFQDI